MNDEEEEDDEDEDDKPFFFEFRFKTPIVCKYFFFRFGAKKVL